MKNLIQMGAVVALTTVAFAGPALPQDLFSLSCPQLWLQRNSIFKAAGYCFHTPRGIRTFGNAGCAYDDERDVPLSDRDRQTINTIQQIERMKGCPQ